MIEIPSSRTTAPHIEGKSNAIILVYRIMVND
jgi:hypothetical protein